ncbi:MAG: hypothetical protein PHF89_05250 [Eubacteriales bacterium]|nr:hypothetical protein [Eubacteriales bacterium]
MAKAGMKRPGHKELEKDVSRNRKDSKNETPPVPEIQGKAKSGKKKA